MSFNGVFKKSISEKEQEKFEKMIKEDMLKLVVEKVKNEEMAKNLCFKEDLKKNYLNKDPGVVLKYFNNLSKMNKKELFSTKEESKTESLQPEEEMEELNEETDPTKEVFEILKKNEELKIKLVITEIGQKKEVKDLRKLVSPFLTALNLNPQFGMFHSALIVGPWYLEWTNNGLCIPRKICSSTALLAVDVENDLKLADVDYVINVVSDVVCRWNVLHNYSKKENNCQHFVDDLLENLGIDSHLKYTGPLGKVLSNLRTFGEDKIVFKIPNEWREKLKTKEQTISFTTHKELDDFATKVQNAFPEWQSKTYIEEYQLLKSIDRAFWLRHLRYKTRKEYQFINYDPLKESDQQVCKCPFGDPTISKSLYILQK